MGVDGVVMEGQQQQQQDAAAVASAAAARRESKEEAVVPALGMKRRQGEGKDEDARQQLPSQPRAQQHARGPFSSAPAPLPGAASANPSPLLALLSDDLLWRVLHHAGAWASGRALCRATHALADARLEALSISPRTPLPVLRALLPRLRGLRSLDLTGLAGVDDPFLRWLLLDARPGLRHLGANYCAQLTPASTPLLARLPSVSLRGCWRLLRPCPSLPSEAVLELQLLALQQNDAARHDGVAKHYEFASPANRGVTEDGAAVGLHAFAGVVYERLSPMLGCQSFSVRQLSYESPDRACFLVRTQQQPHQQPLQPPCGTGGCGGSGATQHYLWLLSRQAAGPLEGCWMTDAIISAEHGLLSFLNLPEDLAAGAGAGGQGDGPVAAQ